MESNAGTFSYNVWTVLPERLIMDELEIKKKLDQLADFQAQQDVLTMQKKALIDEILNAEVRAKLDEIEAEFADKTEAVNTNIAKLEEEIKQSVKVLGTSVKSKFFHAVWVKGRVSWDTKAMDNYAIYHPEILKMRKQGEPSVSLRKI